MDIDQILHTDLFQPQSPSPASSPDHGLLTPPASLDGPRSEQPPFGLFADGLGPFDFLPENPVDDSIAAFGMGLRFFGNIPVNDQLAIDPQLVDSPAPDLSDHDSDDAPLASTSMPSFTVKVGGHGKARRGTVQHGGISKKGSTLHVSALQHHAALPSPASPLPVTSPSPTPGLKAKGLPKPPVILKASSSKKGKAKDNNKDLAVDEDEDDDVPQDWRPSPEVFAKMTSKEKRQLRNKISARNFRVRRKEYISTLEGDIAERDRLLEAVRSELGSTQSENLALRQEIAVLKKVLLEGGGNGTADLPSLNLPPPAPLPIGLGAANATHLNAIGQGGMVPSGSEIATIEINAAASTSSPSSARTPAFAPNTQKDLPSSPTPGRPFWGGQQHHGLGAIGGRGGVTPVHTTLIPEMNISLWGTAANIERAEKNINPLLNAIGTGVIGKVASVGGVYLPAGGEREKEKENKQPSVSSSVSAFDTFADANMFTMKSLDAYRMHLWAKMAAQHHMQQQHIRQSHQRHPHQLTGPASQLRPAYFSHPSFSPKSMSSAGLGSTLSALLSGKHSSPPTPHGALTPPASLRLGARGSNIYTSAMGEGEREAQAAMLAVVASQTLLKKLGNAFWDAFSGSPSPSINAVPSSLQTKNWDVDKVRKVLEGKAIVRVVDVDPFANARTSSSGLPMTAAYTAAPNSGIALGTMSSAGNSGTCCMNVTDLLEESMRSLTLGCSRSHHHHSVGVVGVKMNVGEGTK